MAINDSPAPTYSPIAQAVLMDASERLADAGSMDEVVEVLRQTPLVRREGRLEHLFGIIAVMTREAA